MKNKNMEKMILVVMVSVLSTLTLIAASLYMDRWLEYSPIMLVSVGGIAFVAHSLKNRKKRDDNQRQIVLYNSLLDSIFQAVRDFGERLPCHTPIDRTELIAEQSFVTIRNYTAAVFKLQKQGRAPLDEQQIEEMRITLNARMDNNICSGGVPNIPMPQIDGTRFYPYICYVQDKGIYIYLYLGWQNDILLYNRAYLPTSPSPFNGRF